MQVKVILWDTEGFASSKNEAKPSVLVIDVKKRWSYAVG